MKWFSISATLVWTSKFVCGYCFSINTKRTISYCAIGAIVLLFTRVNCVCYYGWRSCVATYSILTIFLLLCWLASWLSWLSRLSRLAWPKNRNSCTPSNPISAKWPTRPARPHLVTRNWETQLLLWLWSVDWRQNKIQIFWKMFIV